MVLTAPWSLQVSGISHLQDRAEAVFSFWGEAGIE